MVNILTVEENKLNNNLCLCGCGQETNFYQGKYRKFIHGHNIINRRGKNHQSYKRGYYNDNGYTRVLKSEYTNENNIGYVRYHRLIYEEHLKCCLLPWIHLHHIVPINKGGKDVIENLQPLTASQHMSITMKGNKHGKKDMSNRICLLCSSKETKINNKTGYAQWYSYKNGYLCDICGRKYRRQQKSNLDFEKRGGF